MTVLEITTPHGPARVARHPAVAPATSGGGTLILGHGAGGGIAAPDLVAVTAAARAAGWRVALVEQPYRVAGRRTPAPAAHLDVAWLAVVAALRAKRWITGPLVIGGRSSGARVACRTAAAARAAGVLCLAFPLQAPQRRAATAPAPDRRPELDAVAVPLLVVQGERDPFGLPAPDPLRRREIVLVAGDHGLKRDTAAVATAVGAWLATLGRAG